MSLSPRSHLGEYAARQRYSGQNWLCFRYDVQPISECNSYLASLYHQMISTRRLLARVAQSTLQVPIFHVFT